MPTARTMPTRIEEMHAWTKTITCGTGVEIVIQNAGSGQASKMASRWLTNAPDRDDHFTIRQRKRVSSLGPHADQIDGSSHGPQANPKTIDTPLPEMYRDTKVIQGTECGDQPRQDTHRALASVFEKLRDGLVGHFVFPQLPTAHSKRRAQVLFVRWCDKGRAVIRQPYPELTRYSWKSTHRNAKSASLVETLYAPANTAHPYSVYAAAFLRYQVA